MSDLFHCMNLWDHEDGHEKYIDEKILFKYHRPQTVVPNQGLKLLYDAWEYVDKTNTDSDGYRTVCRALFLCQLTLGFLITVLAATSLLFPHNDYIPKSILFTILLLSAVVSIDSLLSPKLMWKQLRLASVELESLIWKYRAGVGEFDPGLDTLRDADDNFDAKFTRCKQNLQNALNNSGGSLLP